ncbi:MAG: hypothetical protein WB919_15500 [Candidatus Sulfotelmatobacter sp.]
MGPALYELRSAVMTLVEVSWEEESEGLKKIPGRMEDKSLSGACIRVKTPIAVGTRLNVRWQFEQFSAITKYCRRDGLEFVVGVQRDKNSTVIPQNRSEATTAAAGVKDRASSVAAAKNSSVPGQPDRRSAEIAEAKLAVKSEPVARGSTRLERLSARGAGREIDNRYRLRASRMQEASGVRRTEVRTRQPPKDREAGKEREVMKRKWFDLAPWRHKQEAPSMNSESKSEVGGGGMWQVKSQNEKVESRAASPAAKIVPQAAESAANYQLELLPVEDIYCAAGIMNPRKGYGVHKVVEMLHSEHIGGLSTEMKRSAVLMALDAAGVGMEQIRKDAKERQSALDAYEAEQRKQADAEWARKEEENVQIQADMERVKEQFMARINRNLEGIAREKATFDSWQATKKQASESMREAVDLCVKPSVAEPVVAEPATPATPLLAKAAAIGAVAKPV